ncbi:hypothetical protein, partial [Salmonella sp. s54836]|uniref:hypothetical protein n=1 Tax=Salmonella sp. s54836 TaxID=3159673 RepID=UPI00397FC69D
MQSKASLEPALPQIAHNSQVSIMFSDGNIVAFRSKLSGKYLRTLDDGKVDAFGDSENSTGTNYKVIIKYSSVVCLMCAPIKDKNKKRNS